MDDGTNTIRDFDASEKDRIVLGENHHGSYPRQGDYSIVQNGDDVRITHGLTVINVENATVSEVEARIFSPLEASIDKVRTQIGGTFGFAGLPFE